jgi:hypothetical protein
MTIPTARTVSIWTRVGSRRGQPISSLGGTSAYPSILRLQHDRSPLPSPARVEVNSSRSAVSAVAAARGQCSPAWLSSRASRPLKPSLGFVPRIVPTPSRRRSKRSGCGGSLSGLSPIQAIRLHNALKSGEGCQAVAAPFGIEAMSPTLRSSALGRGNCPLKERNCVCVVVGRGVSSRPSVPLRDAVHAGGTDASCWRAARMPSAQTQQPRSGALAPSCHRAQVSATLWCHSGHWPSASSSCRR